MVGGVSIGSLIGGMYAFDAHSVSVFGRAKSFASRMASKWRMALDLTYPITAWFTGAECKPDFLWFSRWSRAYAI